MNYYFICSSVLNKRFEVGSASRTDARVHGLSSYFHLDCDHNNESPIDIQKLRNDLNAKLTYANAAIRVNHIEPVDINVFSAMRNVFSRSYLYRMAVHSPSENRPADANFHSYFPIEEVDRCYFVR